MPSARRPSSYRQYCCAKQGEFAVNLCFEVFLSVLMPPEVVMPMSCSLCEPESRADGALAAQELNQLINAVAGGLCQCSGNRAIPRFRPTALTIWPVPPPRLLFKL
jgi:hypothetical protein